MPPAVYGCDEIRPAAEPRLIDGLRGDSELVEENPGAAAQHRTLVELKRQPNARHEVVRVHLVDAARQAAHARKPQPAEHPERLRRDLLQGITCILRLRR